jgi:hypothetical protein
MLLIGLIFFSGLAKRRRILSQNKRSSDGVMRKGSAAHPPPSGQSFKRHLNVGHVASCSLRQACCPVERSFYCWETCVGVRPLDGGFLGGSEIHLSALGDL